MHNDQNLKMCYRQRQPEGEKERGGRKGLLLLVSLPVGVGVRAFLSWESRCERLL